MKKKCSTCQWGRWQGWQYWCNRYKELLRPDHRACRDYWDLEEKRYPLAPEDAAILEADNNKTDGEPGQ